MKRTLAVICLGVVCGLWHSQTLPAQGTPSLIITNARILDGTGRQIPRGAVVVRDGTIVSVSDAAPAVQGAQIIDAKGMTVMPGFIDGHRHVIRGDAAQWLSQEAPARMREYLESGFTTILSAGDSQEQILELRRRLQAGEITGPTLIVTGRVGLAGRAGGAGGGAARGAPPAQGGQGGGRGAAAGGGGRGGDPARFDVSRPPLRPTVAAPAIPHEQTRAAVQALAKAGVDAIKTGITVTPGGPETDTLKVVVEETRKLGILTVTHAVTVEDTLAAVEAGVDVLVHSPHIGRLDEDPAASEKIAKAGIPMMSTLAIFVPHFVGDDNTPLFRDNLPFPWDTLSSAGQGPVNARLLWEAGITYGYGTDTSYHPRESLRHELTPLRLVFSPRDIVRILTRNAAVAVGSGDRIGTLEPGKLADIVLIDGDPLADIDDLLNVAVVIKGGRVVVDKR